MYQLLERYWKYGKGTQLVVAREGPDWVRTNHGIYVPKNLLRMSETEE